MQTLQDAQGSNTRVFCRSLRSKVRAAAEFAVFQPKRRESRQKQRHNL